MPRPIRQAGSVAMIYVRGLAVTPSLAGSMVFAIALVTIVLLAFLSLSQGFQNTFTKSGTDDIAIVLRGGAQSELNSAITNEQFKLTASAVSMVQSGEVNLLVDGRRTEDGSKSNISFRGISADGIGLRKRFRIVTGRLFAPASDEIMVGRAVAQNYRGLEIGSVVRFGRTRWTVVGVFEEAGGLSEGEIWADAVSAQGQFNRLDGYQSIRVKLENPSSFSELGGVLERDPRLRLALVTEREYFSAQAQRTSELIHRLGWPLAIFLSFGALAGAVNAMTALSSARFADTAILRALGFDRSAIFLGAVAESCVIALAAGAIGLALAYAAFSGIRTTLGNGVTEVALALEFTRSLVLQALCLAVLIGVLGGALPAWSAARKSISGSLRG